MANDYRTITGLKIGDHITQIYDNAFSRCSLLSSVSIPNTVTSIGRHSFYGTKYYGTKSNWTSNLLYIGNFLVDTDRTQDIESVEIKSGVIGLCDYSFANNQYLKKISIPESVKFIGKYSFYNCGLLTEIDTPGMSVQTVSNNVLQWAVSIDDNGTHMVTVYCANGYVIVNGSDIKTVET